MENIRTKKQCPHCGNMNFDLGEVFMAGSLLTKIFNIQNRKFSTLTCTKCFYTEFYRLPMKKIQNVLDFMAG
jgi:predicted nucleic-acid-binding Zn-ribbon protein